VQLQNSVPRCFWTLAGASVMVLQLAAHPNELLCDRPKYTSERTACDDQCLADAFHDIELRRVSFDLTRGSALGGQYQMMFLPSQSSCLGRMLCYVMLLFLLCSRKMPLLPLHNYENALLMAGKVCRGYQYSPYPTLEDNHSQQCTLYRSSIP
jgi:hypothetical protein